MQFNIDEVYVDVYPARTSLIDFAMPEDVVCYCS